MNYSEYPELAARTEGEYAHLRELWAFGDLKQMRLQHAILGINTETAEVLQCYKRDDADDELADNSESFQARHDLEVAKELGDVTWYVSLLIRSIHDDKDDEFGRICESAQVISDTLERIDKVDCKRVAEQMDRAANALLKRLKNQMFYGTVPDDLIAHAGVIMLAVADLATQHGYSILEILELNIKKLRKKFPNGFNGVDAETKRHENSSQDLAAAVRKLTPAELTTMETTLAMIGEVHEGKKVDLSGLAGPCSNAFEKIDWPPDGKCVACPACGRTENGSWPMPCPSDDCPSHDTSGNLPSIPLS